MIDPGVVANLYELLPLRGSCGRAHSSRISVLDSIPGSGKALNQQTCSGVVGY